MPPFVSPSFQLLSATAVRPGIVRVRYNYDPKRVDSSLPSDATYRQNYTLSGIHGVVPLSVAPVTSDPQAVDVYLNVPLATGQWSVTVSATVESLDGDTLAAPYALSFDVSLLPSLLPVNGGAVQSDSETELRRHIPSLMKGESWIALIASISSGDNLIRQDSRAAFDQLFRSTASGVFLDRRAGNDGIIRPSNVGMSDALFRQLDIRQTAEKVTQSALLDVLEVFYGTEAVSAHLDTSSVEPFALQDEWSLVVSDGRETLEVIFSDDDFGQIGYASANEVALMLSKAARDADFPMFAQAVVDQVTGQPRVRMFSKAKGLSSRLSVVGGLAQNALGFPALKDEVAVGAGTEWSVTIPEPGVARYVLDDPNPVLLDVEPGDYVNIDSSPFNAANRGSFTITDVQVRWSGAAWSQWFEVENEAVVAQGGPLVEVDDQDILFYRPTVSLPQSAAGTPLSMVQAGVEGFNVVLPATTRAVSRTEGTAAYLQPRRTVDLSTVRVLADGTAICTTATPHGIALNGQVLLDSAVSSGAVSASVAGVPSTTGNPGTTSVNQMSLLGSIRSDIAARSDGAACTMDDDSVLVAGGWNESTATYFNRLNSWAVTSSAVLGSGNGEGRVQRTYNWASLANLPALSAYHRLTTLAGTFTGTALLTGGRNAGGSLGTASMYNRVANTWTTVPNGTLTARYQHTAVMVLDTNGEPVVALVGGLSNATTAVATVQKFTTASGGTISGTFLTETNGRFSAAGCALDTHTWLVAAGARFVGPTITPRHDCVAYNEDTAAYVSIGHMGTARMDHSIITLSDGVAMAVGGVGRIMAYETVDRYLNDCELLHMATGRWRPAGKMRYARRNPHLLLVGDKLYVVGGVDSSGNAVTTTEIYDVKTGRWSVASSLATGSVLDGAMSSVTDGTLLTAGGKAVGGAPTTNAFLFVPGADRLLGIPPSPATVTAVDSTTVFRVDVAEGFAGTMEGGEVELMAAAPGVIDGPFVWDPVDGLAITGTSAILQEDLRQNGQFATVELDDATSFPDEDGWIVFEFGKASQVGPVQYLGKQSDNVLRLDYSFRFPTDIDLGAKVHLFSQRSPYVPTATDLGAFYLTASASGRVAAQETLNTVAAEGTGMNITVDYPGDKGLGNEGYGATGQKVSDVVSIWADDEVDEAVEAAREG